MISINWEPVESMGTAALVAQRTNLSNYHLISMVRTRLMAIQTELDRRCEDKRQPDSEEPK